jgi:hypothetical protein
VIHPVVLLLCFWCPWRTLWVRSRALCLASMGHAALVLIIAPRGRYLIPLNPLFLVAFGLAVEELWRRGAARKWASPTLLLAVVTLSSAPLDLRAERRDKRYVKALAARAASAPSGSVCALSPRVAYYARRRSVTLPRFSDGSEAVRFFERQGVAVVVLRRRWVRRWQPWLPEALIRDGWSVVREAGPERDRRELFVRARAGRPAKQPGR